MKTRIIEGVECTPYDTSPGWVRNLAEELGYSTGICGLCPLHGKDTTKCVGCVAEIGPANVWVPITLIPILKLRSPR
jgi:hypothetical protein